MPANPLPESTLWPRAASFRQARIWAGLALLFVSCQQIGTAPTLAFAPQISLSEDEADKEKLEQSLASFFDDLKEGQWNSQHTNPDERQRYSFFFQSLLRGSRDAEPMVLKSCPLGKQEYLITVAFLAGVPDELMMSRVVELEAIPSGDGYRFRSPFERHTAHLNRHSLGSVTFRTSGAFNEERAGEFVRFKEKFEKLRGRPSEPLQYDCFQSLDELLKAYGLVHDRSKCNFLQHDLGFLWDEGRRYATGTGNEDYRFGYVGGALAAAVQNPDEVYRPYATGVAAFYGGYSLSGDTMLDLARQFREELERRPAIDFLEEFEKGRKSSIERHFSHYVMCAFLCEEIIAQNGEVAALQLIESGEDGARFFAGLEEQLGVTRENFHETILRLIGASI